MNTKPKTINLTKCTNYQLDQIRAQHLRVGLPEHSPNRTQVEDEIEGRTEVGVDINDKAEVLRGITDPYNRGGQTGTIVGIDMPNDTITLKFEDGKTGMYQTDTLIKR